MKFKIQNQVVSLNDIREGKRQHPTVDWLALEDEIRHTLESVKLGLPLHTGIAEISESVGWFTGRGYIFLEETSDDVTSEEDSSRDLGKVIQES